jgi:aryl-alcohol dehydrogenase-like predicted oxidoreductase
LTATVGALVAVREGLQYTDDCALPPARIGQLNGRVAATRRWSPAEQARTANQALVDLLSVIAEHKGATPAQIALAWLLAQHSWFVPIPGTTKPHRLRENTNAVDVELTSAELDEIIAASDQVDVQGDRYPAHMQRWINR